MCHRHIEKNVRNLAQTARKAISQHNEEEHESADWYKDNVDNAPKICVITTSKGTVAKKIDDFATEIKSVKLHHACEVSWDKKGYPV